MTARDDVGNTGRMRESVLHHFLAALDAAFKEDDDALHDAFVGLPQGTADALVTRVSADLASAARVSGDYVPWAFAVNRLPWPHMRLPVAEFAQRIDAWTVQERPRPDTPRRRVARLAMRLLRAGVGGRELLRQLDAANSSLDTPLAADVVGDVATWAANAVKAGPHAA